MHLHYDDNDQLEAIETFEPCVAEYDDMKLIQMPANMIEQNFLEKGFTIKHDDEGFYIMLISFHCVLAVKSPCELCSHVQIVCDRFGCCKRKSPPALRISEEVFEDALVSTLVF